MVPKKSESLISEEGMLNDWLAGGGGDSGPIASSSEATPVQKPKSNRVTLSTTPLTADKIYQLGFNNA